MCPCAQTQVGEGGQPSSRAVHTCSYMNEECSQWLLQRLLRPGFTTTSLRDAPAVHEVVRELAAIVAGPQVGKSKGCRHWSSAAQVCLEPSHVLYSHLSFTLFLQAPSVDGLVVSCGSLDISLQLACTILAVLAQPHLGLSDDITAGVGNASIWHGSSLAALFERCCQVVAEEMASAFAAESDQIPHCDADDVAEMVRQHASALGDVTSMLRDVLRCWADEPQQLPPALGDACVFPEGETGLWWQDSASKVSVHTLMSGQHAEHGFYPVPSPSIRPLAFWLQRHPRLCNRS